MQTLELSIFRFCATTHYEYYFQKYPIVYDNNLTLFDALASIDGLGFDASMGLRVQGLCVFDDVPLYKLVHTFGEALCLEPLSQKYVSKDLALDKDAMIARYEWFFDKHTFITPSDRYELYKYLWANTISLYSDEAYLGDGFFLYMDWLLARYPKHFDTLIHTLANAQTGVMSYAPIEALIYIKKPNTPNITHTIQALINKVARFGQCPGCGRAWIKELDSMRLPAIPDSAITALKATQQEHKAFIVFDAYASAEAQTLVSSTQALLQALQYPTTKPASAFLPLGGYFERIVDTRSFVKRAIYNLALANKQGAVVVFGDYASYSAMRFAQATLLNDPTLLDEVRTLYGEIDYDLHSTRYIQHIIADTQASLWAGDARLDALTLVAYPSLTHHTSQLDSTITIHDSHIESKLGGKWIDILESLQDFSHLRHYNYEGYLKECARMRFAGIDAGADILVVSSVELFRAFTTLAKTSARILGRDMCDTPTLFLPQLALLARGIHDGLGLSSQNLTLALA